MKILMTGMASSHCSISSNVTFFNTLYKIFSEFAEVTISNPKLSWTRADLQKFDAIILGMTPPTSLSANNIYGALHVLDLMYESNKLRLVVDSPQIWQYKNSLSSFKNNPNQIFRSIYENRRDYKQVQSTRSDVAKSVADKMSSLKWPKTYVPLLPWGTEESASESLRFIPSDRLVGLKVDSYLLEKKPNTAIGKTSWAVDNVKSDWWKSLTKLISKPGVPVKTSARSDDFIVDSVISGSIGVVIPPQDRKVGTWWSYRYPQSVSLGAPVVTYWQDTYGFDPSWGVLAYQVEDMPEYARQQLAEEQYLAYKSAIPSRDEIIDVLKKDLIGSSKERI